MLFLAVAALLTGHAGASFCPEWIERWGYSGANSIAVSGRLVLLGAGSVLLVADVSDPMAPRVLGELLAAPAEWRKEPPIPVAAAPRQPESPPVEPSRLPDPGPRPASQPAELAALLAELEGPADRRERLTPPARRLRGFRSTRARGKRCSPRSRPVRS